MVESLPVKNPPRNRGGWNRVAFLAFAVYLTLLLGTNSVAETGGVMAWLPLWRLPAAGNNWAAVGAISLLPPISLIAWLLARLRAGDLRSFSWGWARITLPLAGLALVGLLSTLRGCPGSSCHLTATLRLLLLLLHLFWIYLYLVNEKPDLFWIVVAVIGMQSVVAIGQFVGQRDLGLAFLGESPLDPQISGISVVMRGSERWLRGYGFATHPNVLAGTLVPMLLLLPVINRSAGLTRRAIGALALTVGFAALLSTLTRWANACLAFGLGLNLLPWLWGSLRSRHWSAPPLGAGAWSGLIVVFILFFAIYGETAAGRVAGLDAPVERRSLDERSRDTAISLRIIDAHFLNGVGLGEYGAVARTYDAWAKTVSVVPLLLMAELGIAGLVVWLWLVVGPVLRPGALSRFAPETALWLAFWLLGLLELAPNPLIELRSALLVGLVAAVVAQSGDAGGRSQGNRIKIEHG